MVGGAREGEGGWGPTPGRLQIVGEGRGAAGKELERGGELRRREAVVGAALDGTGDRRRHGCWLAWRAGVRQGELVETEERGPWTAG